MMHALPVELLMLVAVTPEKVGWKDVVIGLGFLETQDVGLLFGDQPLDQYRARPHRIDIPRSDFQPVGHVSRLARPLR